MRYLLLFLSCILVEAQPDLRPAAMLTFTNIAQLVAQASPFSGQSVQVLGYRTPGDGGDGIFYPSSVNTSTNTGEHFLSSLSGTNLYNRIWKNGIKDVRGFGAYCDGTNDDSVYITAAINSLGANGGTVYIPNKSAFNITLATNQNVLLLGDGSVKDYRSGIPSAYWRPYNTNQDMIRIGNDTTFVKGIKIQNATLFGNSSTAAGVYFGGGAFENFLDNVTIWKFQTNMLFKGGTTYPCSLIFVSNFTTESSGATNSRSVAMYNTGGTGYTTAIYFSKGHLSGSDGVGEYVLESDGVQCFGSDLYFDCGGDDHGLLFKKTESGADSAWMRCSNVSIDSDNSADVLINGYLEIRDFGWWVRGTTSVDGRLLLPSLSEVNPTGGTVYLPYQSQASFFQITGEAAFVDILTVNGYDSRRRIYSDGALNFENASGNLNYYGDQNINFWPTNGGIVFHGGAAGGVTFLTNHIYMDNDRSIQFKDTSGIYRGTLYPFSTNIQLNAAVGTLALDAVANINATAAGFIFTAGSSGAFTFRTGDLYVDNNRAFLFKDGLGNYFSALSVTTSGTVQLFGATQSGSRVDIGTDNATGQIRFYTAALQERWRMDENGSFIGVGDGAGLIELTSSNTTYTTTLSVLDSGDLVITNNGALSDKLSLSSGYAGGGTKFKSDDGTYKSAAQVVATLTNYVELMLGNPNSAVVTGSTNVWIYPEANTLAVVTAHLFIPSSSGSVTFDLKKNGTTVLSAPVSISAGATNATATISVSSISANDRLAGEITASGTTAYGAILRLGTTIP